jgi:hypothetical protein
MKFDTATSNPSAAGVQQRLDRCEYSRRPKALASNVGRHTACDHVGALQQTDKPRLSAQEVYGDPVELNITSAFAPHFQSSRQKIILRLRWSIVDDNCILFAASE